MAMENRLAAFAGLFVAAGQDDQIAFGSLGAGTAQRAVQHDGPAPLQSDPGLLLGGQWKGAAFNHDQTIARGMGQTLITCGYLLQGCHGRQRRNDRLALFSHFTGGAGTLSTQALQPGHLFFNRVTADNFIPCLEQIRRHGRTHDSQAQKSHFLHRFLHHKKNRVGKSRDWPTRSKRNAVLDPRSAFQHFASKKAGRFDQQNNKHHGERRHIGQRRIDERA